MKYFNEVQAVVRQVPGEAAAAARKAWFAGVGAVNVVGQKTGTLFDELVEEGRRVQETETGRVDQIVSQARQRVAARVNDAVAYVQGHSEQAARTAISRLGIPTRSEIVDLSARMATLTARIEGLSRTGGADVQ